MKESILEAEFEEIWEEALPLQDKRRDKGHAKVVREYANQLSDLEGGDKNVIIPAAILHDIGWSSFQADSPALRRPDKTGREERIEHEQQGARLAKDILSKVSYPIHYAEEIIAIILGHDTKKRAEYLNEGVVRDADKLWRYSQIGFWADIRRQELQERCGILGPLTVIENDLAQEGFMYTKSGMRIAAEEIAKRKVEISGDYKHFLREE